jgi:group I intron endonuclease
MTIGIYCIENLVNGKRYIGQSFDVERRIKEHKQRMKGRRHKNEYLQRTFDKFGDRCFKFCVIAVCEKEKLDELEIFYISKFDTMNEEFGYNMDSGGNKRKEWSELSKEKIRNLHRLGKYNFLFGNKYNFGKKLTEEIKRKISKSKLGKKKPDGFSEKMSVIAKNRTDNRARGNKSNTGRKFSAEHISKLVESRKRTRERKLLELT